MFTDQGLIGQTFYNANNLRTQQIEVGQVLVLPNVSAKEPTATKNVSTIGQIVQKTEPVLNTSYKFSEGIHFKIAVADTGRWI